MALKSVVAPGSVIRHFLFATDILQFASYLLTVPMTVGFKYYSKLMSY